MNTICPKCECENWNETIGIQNNPNLVSCENCPHVYFVEVKLSYKKAYKSKEGGYYTAKGLRELE